MSRLEWEFTGPSRFERFHAWQGLGYLPGPSMSSDVVRGGPKPKARRANRHAALSRLPSGAAIARPFGRKTRIVTSLSG